MELTAEQADALENLLDALDPHMWGDLGPHLNCGETEIFARFLRVFDRGEIADGLLASHATDDDGGDMHEAVYDEEGFLDGFRYREEGE